MHQFFVGGSSIPVVLKCKTVDEAVRLCNQFKGSIVLNRWGGIVYVQGESEFI